MLPRCFYKNCKDIGQSTGLGLIDLDATEATGAPIYNSVYLCEKHKNKIRKFIRRMEKYMKLRNKQTDEWEDAIDNKVVLDRWEKDGIKSDLTGLIVAPENVTKDLAGGIGTEHDGKRYFTYDEAMELEEKVLKPNGWRLPTRSEWVLLAEEFGQNENGEPDGNIFAKKLNLPLPGYFWQGTLYSGTTGAYYWSRVSYSTTHAYDLHFNTSGGLSPQNYHNKMDGFAIRCVKDNKKGENK